MILEIVKRIVDFSFFIFGGKMALVLDQSQINWSSSNAFYFNEQFGQTFKSGLSGYLCQIKMKLSKRNENPAENLVIELCNVVDGLPGSTIYTSQEITPASLGYSSGVEVTIIFSNPHYVVTDSFYAILLHAKTSNYNEGYYIVDTNPDGGYSNGNECYSTNGGITWYNDPYDLYFKTYINKLPSPLPTFYKS